jgi:hypothetical protein
MDAPMPGWEVALWIVFALVMIPLVIGSVVLVRYMTKENRAYSAEEKLWRSLAVTGRPAEGVIQHVRMQAQNLTRGGSSGQTVCAVVFDVNYIDGDGAAHAISIPTFVEEALLPQFLEPLKKIHLLHEPGKPASVAIDRTRTPLEIPRER